MKIFEVVVRRLILLSGWYCIRIWNVIEKAIGSRSTFQFSYQGPLLSYPIVPVH